MEYGEIEHIMAHLEEMQPHVPEWCKAEHMEYVVPQKELWRYNTNSHDSLIKSIRRMMTWRRKKE